MPDCRTFVFDLDGTLVDSAPAILACMEAAVRAAGHAPVVGFDSSLIGPPLRETLARVTGLADAAAIEALADDFKRRYDAEAAALTPAFHGIDDLLEGLRRHGVRLHLATNKRRLPTLRILEARGWRERFGSVYAQDAIPGGYPSKARMLGHLLAEQALDPAGTVYVGDTREDGVAAHANAMPFVAVGWGYGGDTGAWDLSGPWRRVSSPAEILANLAVT